VAERLVKSAQRVLEVLEHFAVSRTPANVKEISDHLDYPQSSTSMLLSTLVSLGYLSHDPATRLYRPTWRVMLLGSWIHDEVFGQGSLVSVMDQLRRRTGQSVIIGIRQNLHVRYILSLKGSQSTYHTAPGRLRPICLSALGKALLAAESDDDIVRIARRSNAEILPPELKVRIPELMKEMEQIRQRGWAISSEYPRPGIGGLGMVLPPVAGQPPLALGLGAAVHRINANLDKWVAALGQACEFLPSVVLDQSMAREDHGL
jgi:DNA-binding IclR family transcriptional regulator